MNNGEKLIEVLEHLLANDTMSIATREVITYILEDTDFSTDRICRVASLMVICQQIFEHYPEALIQMLRSMRNPYFIIHEETDE